jgi:MFS superfamily sulfate permease-like transporter
MAFTALLVGGLLVVAGLPRLGWIAEFLSTPVITGILAGIAVEIAVRQLPNILGCRAAARPPSGGCAWWPTSSTGPMAGRSGSASGSWP